ncbi:MAG: hypothetical protein CL398_08635 [Acidiferrobacteraceae bacterium]|nr:hypothetical protein [Acidiferrobacteraceae bacterium]|tara:strand:+ start:619 stop:1047 length:429 start_codon:yes stop_codon:yes gene_type:complete
MTGTQILLIYLRRAFILCCIPLILGQEGCDGGTNSGITADVSGVWTGTWTSSSGQKGRVTGKFSQEANTFSGPMTISRSPCFDYEYVAGTISGSDIEFGIVNNAIIFEASVKGSRISGIYYVYSSPGGYCTGDSGTVVLRRY